MPDTIEITAPPAFNPAPEVAAEDHPQTISMAVRVANLIAVILPFVGFLVVVALLWGSAFYWSDLWLLLAMYLLTALGITVGFHRLFTHKSFETNSVIQCILGVLGSMAVQGPVLKWVAVHRRHHQHSDDADDPHSPHNHGRGLRGLLSGIWHSHMGWFFDPDPPDLPRYVADLQRNNAVRRVSALFPVWVASGLLIPAALGGLITQTWTGVLTGFAWGGLARVFLVHHITWSVNSICHLWGRQPFRSHDQSRNNAMIGVLSLGEGWHNTHHAFPTSARHGLHWWEVDISYWVIRGLAMVGLAWNIKLPSKHAMIRERRA